MRKKTTLLKAWKKYKNTKETYTEESKSIGKKVGFAAVFFDITKRGALSEEVFICTAEMIAIKILSKEVNKIEDKRWVIYALSQSSMQFIKYSKENHSILNQIYDILVEIQNQGK